LAARRCSIPGIGKRWASVCDTPEQELLVERYRPRIAAEFFAGMELTLLHVGLAALAMLRRHRAGRIPDPGARACAGLLILADFASDFRRLGIQCIVIG